VNSNVNNLEAISNNMKHITSQIQQGKGWIGGAIYNQQIQHDLMQTINNLENITAQIQQGQGVAGTVIYNQQMQQDIKTSANNLKLISEQTRVLLTSMQQQLDELPEITDKVKPLLDEADKTIKATQQIWPLSSGMPENNKQTLTSPEATE
jgi:hypothetical protein